MTLRAATPDDAELLARHRAAVWMEVGHWGAEILDFIPTWTAYVAAAIADGSYRAVIAEDGGASVASAGMHAKPALPRPGQPVHVEARIQGVYVEPSARKRGIARAMMEHLIAEARTAGFQRIILHPSNDARPLYLSMGFEPLDELGLTL